MAARVVITGIGMVTPLGRDPAEVLRRLQAGETAAAPPRGFPADSFACPLCAEINEFDARPYLPEPKMIRLMNREAQCAVAAARLALADARLAAGKEYRPEEIALFGATGLAGLPLAEFDPLIRTSTGPDGQLDLRRFGTAGLKSISPLLSFKVLANMPVCFVSICENLQGPNAVYTPWEGQGAQAIESGLRAIQSGEARCAVVGGCDSKAHELGFISLQQQGLFRSWQETGRGMIPGEGAVFLVLEELSAARSRGAKIYAWIQAGRFESLTSRSRRRETYTALLQSLLQAAAAGPPISAAPRELGALVGAADGDGSADQDEAEALAALELDARLILQPKRQVGNLLAAAAALQVGTAALLVRFLRRPVLANCLGHGREQAAWLLGSAENGG